MGLYYQISTAISFDYSSLPQGKQTKNIPNREAAQIKRATRHSPKVSLTSSLLSQGELTGLIQKSFNNRYMRSKELSNKTEDVT